MAMVSIRVSPETQAMLRQIAAQEHSPLSAIVDEAARAYRNELLWRRAEVDWGRLVANNRLRREIPRRFAPSE